jgi:hypothetical protein
MISQRFDVFHITQAYTDTEYGLNGLTTQSMFIFFNQLFKVYFKQRSFNGCVSSPERRTRFD